MNYALKQVDETAERGDLCDFTIDIAEPLTEYLRSDDSITYSSMRSFMKSLIPMRKKNGLSQKGSVSVLGGLVEALAQSGEVDIQRVHNFSQALKTYLRSMHAENLFDTYVRGMSEDVSEEIDSIDNVLESYFDIE